jgi:uncharacterized repeat protein (TIGR03803 family)
MKSLFAMKNRLAANWVLAFIAVIVLSAYTSAEAQAHYRHLRQFSGGEDGSVPLSGLLADHNTLYGTTASGGDPLCHCGVVFKLKLTQGEWKQRVLYSFTGVPDGASPWGKLVEDSAGNLYGTTYAGGAFGLGTVFKLDPDTGQETVLYSFTGPPDGQNPQAGLVLDSAGNLYGTTLNGGACQYPQGCGVVFKVDTAGNETIVHTFTGGYDGAFPGYGALVRDPGGNLYGVTNLQGAGGVGVVFKINVENETAKALYSFDPANKPGDGSLPLGGLLRLPGNIFIGTTTQGGTSGWGTVFKLAGGTETVLYNFTKGADGGYPQSDLVRDLQGRLFGTTLYGGDNTDCPPYGCGTVFKLSPAGVETVLHRFTGSEGANPWAGVIKGPGNNSYYGTTTTGGHFDQGVVFEMDLPPAGK